jgi:peroxiredoxin
MKPMFARVVLAIALCCSFVGPRPATAAEGGSKRVSEIVAAVNAKIRSGQRSAEALAPELAKLDALAADKSAPVSEAAEALFIKGVIHLQVLQDGAKAGEAFRTVKKNYPNTPVARQVDDALAMVEKMERSAGLAVGKKFPDFQETDTQGKPLSLSRFKGKVVLVDFWATWCGPCRVELPNVLSTYNKYHSKGFDIIGISLDQSREQLDSFVASNKMPWPQYFDGKGWQNKLAQHYGIMGIPATYLVDGQGTIIARDLRGPELEKAVAAALAKK